MYRHTFHLVDGDEISLKSNSQELPTFKYGDIFTFTLDDGRTKYTIPVLSILYVDTEEVRE